MQQNITKNLNGVLMSGKYPEELLSLIAHLKKLPGVGMRTAERFAFEFLNWAPSDLSEFGSLVSILKEKVPACQTCGCLTHQGTCRFCDSSRDSSSLCILASARDAYAIEETKTYRGLYHVIEHLLSPLDGRHVNTLRLDRIEKRIEIHSIREVIIAFDSTLEGDATALFIKNHLRASQVSISRLAFGLPVGSTLEYIDGGTLARALAGRQAV